MLLSRWVNNTCFVILYMLYVTNPLNLERGLQLTDHGCMHSLFILRITLEVQDWKVVITVCFLAGEPEA